jgi:ADP-ribose pyrophosphatase YjhB (NUDIX family)
MTENMKFAPREIFEQILEYMAIPTFDIVIEYGEQGIILVRRKIAPYKDVWALPGLRMYKGENIDDTLQRIAQKELGLRIDTSNKVIIGQFVGKFKTEHDRQDISTGYLMHVEDDQEIVINQEHFYEFCVTREIPENIGAMYRYYLKEYYKNKF